MQIFILSPNPNINHLFISKLESLLTKNSEIINIKKIMPIKDIKALYNNNEEKILAIDPDFCDWEVRNEDLNKIKNLKAVCLQTTSFNWIDTKFLQSKSIPVINLRGFSTEAVAEWAFMMTLNVARKIPLITQQNWKYDTTIHTGIELKGRTVGIIGLGAIGKRIAEISQAFGMNVIYWSKNSRDSKFKYVSLNKLMQTADVIYPTLAKNADTYTLITDKMLKSMKISTIFISIVNGIYNHDLLTQMIKQEKIYGYANERNDTQTPGLSGNIWTGLKLGWCTQESFKRNTTQWMESIVNANKDQYPTKVN